MKTFRCGHDKSEENSRFTKGYLQCKNCESQRQRERRERAKRLAALGEAPSRSDGSYQHLANATPLFSDDGGAAQIGRASASLLRALYRQHPYVFDAAERSGRMAVRP